MNSHTSNLRLLVRDAVEDMTGRQLAEADFEVALEDLGLDSLVLAEVMCEIEDHLGVELDPGLFNEVAMCSTLARMLQLYGDGVA